MAFSDFSQVEHKLLTVAIPLICLMGIFYAGICWFIVSKVSVNPMKDIKKELEMQKEKKQKEKSGEKNDEINKKSSDNKKSVETSAVDLESNDSDNSAHDAAMEKIKQTMECMKPTPGGPDEAGPVQAIMDDTDDKVKCF